MGKYLPDQDYPWPTKKYRKPIRGIKWAVISLLILFSFIFLHFVGIDLIKSTPDCQNFSSNGCL